MCMNTMDDVEILPEDQVKLTTDQKNLIALALEKQLPLEDAEFLEHVQKKSDANAYAKIHNYFGKKYGEQFGEIFLATITRGEEGCKAAVNKLETARAQERMIREAKN